MTLGISWRRVAVAGTFLAAIGMLGIGVPLAWQHQLDIVEGVRTMPRPRPADDATQAAIVSGLLEGHRYEGMPRPPPEPGDPPRGEATWRYPLLVRRTSPMPDDAFSPPGMVSGRWLSSDDPLLRGIPRKLRQELVMANTGPTEQRAPALSGLRLIDKDKTDLDWPDFHDRYPDTPGILETTRAVVSDDGREALIYAWNNCDYLCGEGALFLLRRDGERWRLSKVLVISNA